MRFTLALLTALAASGGCSQSAPSTGPYKPTYSVLQLMEGPIGHAAEVYWDAVSTVVDENGITDHRPQNDEEWEAVWAAGITLAESGNLLMMPPRARDNGDWMTFSAALVDAGVEATKAAEAKDPEKVLEVGERVYDACTRCHAQYLPM